MEFPAWFLRNFAPLCERVNEDWNLVLVNWNVI